MPSRDPNQRFQPEKSRHQVKVQAARPRQRQVRQIQQSQSLSIYLVRLIILGLGASTIAGTIIATIHPPQRQLAAQPEQLLPATSPPLLTNLNLGRSSPKLTSSLAAARKQYPQLQASYLFVDLDREEFASFEAERVLPAASTIKLPILVALFQEIDSNRVQLDENLTIDRQSIAGGAGNLQFQKPGTEVSVLVAATKMITISDNTATNAIVNRLGGKDVLNQRFRSWGLTTTTIANRLPDLEGTNLTTATELARLTAAIVRGGLVSATSRREILRMMSNTERNTMLPQGLSQGAKIAHKTGDIGSTIADVGSIEQSSGRRYIASVIVTRPYNAPAGPEAIRTFSRIADRYFLDSDRDSPNSLPWKAISPVPKRIFIKKN